MKIYLTDQTAHFPGHLKLLSVMPVMAYKPAELVEKVSTVQLNTKGPPGELDLAFFFNYQVFPQNILTFQAQWQHENRQMRAGDTIVQQVYLPPLKTFSQKIIFGVRIKEIIRTPQKIGFSYETIEGHVEKGISTFTIEQEKEHIIFKIHTFSEPGNFLTKMLGPVFSVPYQAYCTRAALQNVKQKIELQ